MRTLTTGIALTIFALSATAQDVYPPNENLVVDGIPEVPMSIVRDVERYTEFRSALFSDWHPDRDEMIVWTRFADTYQIHSVKSPGGARTQLTFFDEPARSPIIDPVRGDYILFTMDTGGGEFFQIYRLDLSTRDVVLISDGEKRNSYPLFNREGTAIIYSRVDANEDGAFTEFHLVNPQMPETDRVVGAVGGGAWIAMDWNHKDEEIICLEYRSITESYVHRLDVSTGEMTPILPEGDQGPAYFGYTVYAGKDPKVYYTITDAFSDFRQLVKIDQNNGEIEIITEDIKWDVSDFDITDDRDHIAFVTNEAGIGKLHVIDTRQHKPVKLPEIPIGSISGVKWNKGLQLGFTLGSAKSPSDAYSIDLSRRSPRRGDLARWTESETGMISAKNFVEPELIEWESFDGLKISGFLYTPPDKFAGKRPVIVNIHGGPESQWRPRFLGRSNYWINELGIAIIYPNVRGSSGYGKEFVKLDNGLNREGSYKDINALFDWIETRSDLDKDRIMVTGGSYGGFMTLAVAANHSDRIACSVDVVGISNLRTFLENTEGYRRDLRRAEYGDERDPEVYAFLEQIAPLNKVENIKKPMFVVQGANDPRVPKSEADQIVAALKRTETPVWYLVAMDEGHGFAKKPNADYQFYSTVQFVKQYLLNPVQAR